MERCRGSRVALKKSSTQNAGDAGKMPLALKNFGTQNSAGAERQGVGFLTQKNSHSMSMAGSVQLSQEETGVADEERCGDFALIFFRTKEMEEIAIFVETAEGGPKEMVFSCLFLEF